MAEKIEHASVILTGIRDALTRSRNDISDLMRSHPGFVSQIEYLDGYLTTGIIAMYDSLLKVTEQEIKNDDHKFGKSYSFKPRGIGMDNCPGCFVCCDSGGMMEMVRNISAFVRSKEDGKEIVSWFNGGAYLDYRPNEPTWIQVKVGSCEKHVPALVQLRKAVNVHGVIRQSMIDSVIKQYTK